MPEPNRRARLYVIRPRENPQRKAPWHLIFAGRRTYADAMCRNIRQLHNFEPPATSEEVGAAALQYVRKVTGSTRPSRSNQAAFDSAVAEIAAATQHLLDHLVTSAPPKDRDVESLKARSRAQARHARSA